MTSTRQLKELDLYVSATASTFPSSPWSTFPDSFQVSGKSTAASSGTEPNCCMPTLRQRCLSSLSSQERSVSFHLRMFEDTQKSKRYTAPCTYFVGLRICSFVVLGEKYSFYIELSFKLIFKSETCFKSF